MHTKSWMKKMLINMKGKKKGRKRKGWKGSGGRKGFIVASKCRTGDLPGGPVVKTPHFTCTGCSSIPVWGTKIPHTTR